MAVGLLRLTGTMRVDQFWPHGGSDGDTATVDIAPSGAFSFRPHPTAPLQPTKVFYSGRVLGRSGAKPTVKNNQVVIRLQGIDAAELHYEAQLLKHTGAAATPALRKQWNKRYRQWYGESAAAALGKSLSTSGSAVVACHVDTAVDHPNEVFDTYGRFIGNIFVQNVDVNQWMVAQGWAFPSFYTTMSNTEIDTVRAAANLARSKKLGIWKGLSHTLGKLDTSLLYRNWKTKPTLQADKGPVLFPKIFRRLVSWTVNSKLGLASGSFKAFLVHGTPDRCFKTDEFLKFGIHSTQLPSHTLDQFIGSNNAINFEPDGLVFKEQQSTLVDANGNKIGNW